MPIKFGDSLENQNSNYPIVDLIGNHAKGVQYLATFNQANLVAIPAAKRGTGTVVIETSTGLAYVYTGASLANGTWDNPAVGWAPLGEATQTTNLSVQIPAGQSFGKYVLGDTITVGAGGWNALEIIRDAITGFVDPTIVVTGSRSQVAYSLSQTTNYSHAIDFSVTNNNQLSVDNAGTAFKIDSIVIRRRAATSNSSGGTTIGNYTTTVATINSSTTGANGVAFAALNTQGAVTAQNFSITDVFNIPAQQVGTTDSNNYYYSVEVVGKNGSGVNQDPVYLFNTTNVDDSNFIEVANYVTPTASCSIARTSATTPTAGVIKAGTSFTYSNTSRLMGDYNSTVTFTITNSNSAIPLTSYTIERNLPGVGWATVASGSNPSGNVTYTENALTVTNTYDTIQYRINLVSAYGTTPTLGTTTITFYYLSYVGVSANDNQPTSAAQTAGAQTTNNTALTETNIEAFNTRVLVAAAGAQHQLTDTSTGGISLTTSAGQFAYVAIPYVQSVGGTTTSEITNINKQNNANEITAWCTSDPDHATVGLTDDAFTTDFVSVTNVFGNTRNYVVYRTNSQNAYSVASTLFIY
jgi:hypothetical protein